MAPIKKKKDGRKPTLLGLSTNCRKSQLEKKARLNFVRWGPEFESLSDIIYQHGDISWNSLTCSSISRGD